MYRACGGRGLQWINVDSVRNGAIETRAIPSVRGIPV